MSFLSSLLSIFGGSKSTNASKAPAAEAPAPKPNKNVYNEARTVPIPDWAEGLNNTELPEHIREHIRCKYVPSFGWKKIMTTQVGPDGNLLPEYDGIAGDCGAVKTFGMALAKRDGRTTPYKYVDLNMAYRCCCGIPKKCPFLLMALGEMDSVNSKRG